MIKQEHELTEFEKQIFSFIIDDCRIVYYGFSKKLIKNYVIKEDIFCLNYYSTFHEKVVQTMYFNITKYIKEIRNLKLESLLENE